ncbi:MAG: 50S ribosomal protein L10 [Candidatus Shikimatogenerans sp. JK-2022]|nr:50S ribosomal protein L10 [Candidatus Shikimatogenerans bostrichidophilus]
MQKKKEKKFKKIKKIFKKYNYIYFINISRLNSNLFFNFKKDCFNKKIKLINIKNNILKKFFLIYKKKKFIKKINPILKKSTTLMLIKNYSNSPAILIKKHKILIENVTFPIFKASFLKDTFFIGEKKLNILCKLKSQEEIIKNILIKFKKKIINNIYNIFNFDKLKIILYTIKKKIKNEKN